MKCPKCGADDLEVTGTIIKNFNGVFSDNGNLSVETVAEEITYIECFSCHESLSLDLIRNWT